MLKMDEEFRIYAKKLLGKMFDLDTYNTISP